MSDPTWVYKEAVYSTLNGQDSYIITSAGVDTVRSICGQIGPQLERKSENELVYKGTSLLILELEKGKLPMGSIKGLNKRVFFDGLSSKMFFKLEKVFSHLKKTGIILD